MKNTNYRNNKGFVTLVAVLVIGVVGLTVAVALLLLGLGFSRTSYDLKQSGDARSFADACADEALNRLRLDINYGGGETISFEGGDCDILPIIDSGTETPTIQVEGRAGNMHRRIEIELLQVQPRIVTGSWREIAEF